MEEDLDIAPHIIQAVVNHRGPLGTEPEDISNPVTDKHYRWVSHRRQKAEALVKWADHIGRLVAGKSNIVTLPMKTGS
jgi:hypothetical protein